MYAAIPIHIYIISLSQLWLRGGCSLRPALATLVAVLGLLYIGSRIHVATEPDF